MSWVLTAIAGSAVIGAYGSKKAADAQKSAAGQAADVSLDVAKLNIEAQREALDKILAANESTLDRQTALNEPWQQAGLDALQYIRTGTMEGWLQPLGGSTQQQATRAPTREEIVSAAGGTDNPQAILQAAQREGYTTDQIEQAFGMQPGEASNWVAQNANIVDLAGSDRPEDVFRAMQQYGLTPEQVDEQMGLQPGEARAWIAENVTAPTVNSLLTAANAPSTLQPYQFQSYTPSAGTERGQYTAPAPFEFSRGEFQYGTYERPEFQFEEDPGYQFRLAEGEKAINRNRSVRGRLAAPAGEMAIARYSQGLAAQEYANAFNRYLATTDRDQTQYNVDRAFAYGDYIDDYNREFGEYSDQRNFGYNVYQGEEARKAAERAAEAQRFQQQQQMEYADYTNRINLENQRRQNVLNTAFQIANLGRGATASTVGNIGASGNNVMNAISTTTGNIAQQNTAGANAAASGIINAGQATAGGYQGIMQSANQGIENYLLYKTMA